VINLARFVLTLALVVLCARVASADDRARARTAFRAGSQHYNLGEFQQALDSFKEAYRRVEDPSFLFNIAQCERQLGHKREAVREYRAYLNNADNAGNREAVKETIAQLQKELDADDERARDAARPAIAPPPAIVTPPAETAATPVLVATPTPQIEHKPAYKKWWVWTIVGGVVAAGAATGLALALTRSGPAPHVDTSLGTASPW
jgi:tetratricopeptide (TPR) repeat protein